MSLSDINDEYRYQETMTKAHNESDRDWHRREQLSYKKKQKTSAWAVIISIIACGLIVLFSAIASAEVYDAEAITDAIYWAEGGLKSKKPYGVLSIPCDSPQKCRKIALNTVQNQFIRWQVGGGKGDFLVSLRNRYAPLEADNDPQGLNSNWLRNLRWFINNPKEVNHDI